MLRTILADELRFLTFRPMGAAVRDHRRAYVAFGLVCAWAAGVGRYWDNPRAEWWQAAGLEVPAGFQGRGLSTRRRAAPCAPMGFVKATGMARRVRARHSEDGTRGPGVS